MRDIGKAISATFSDYVYIVVAFSFAANFLALDYILLSQSTTFRIMAAQNTALFNWSALTLSAVTAVLFGLSLSMLIYIFRLRRSGGVEAAPSTLFGTIIAAVASGCPVCGVWLLPLFGIAGSLAVFPFQGLELRLLAILLLGFSISRSATVILGTCVPGHAVRRFGGSFAVISVAIGALFLLPYVPVQYKVKFQRAGISAPTQEQVDFGRRLGLLADQVNPSAGFTLELSFGNIGYQLVQSGAIDFEKFAALYDQSGSPLTVDQLKIFDQKGLDKPITITPDNAYFLLNLFWAFGLANENPILTEGQIETYSNGRLGDFASTGGWTIASKPLDTFFAKAKFAPLTKSQQERLQRVAENVYRPCCGNSTAFPDCNHGMALLGVLELMAASDATEDQLFEAAKYFSAFWFPKQAFDVAVYFAATEDKEFVDIDPRIVVSEQYFSGRGWSQIKGWIEANLGETRQPVPQGGGCGV